MGSIPVPIPGPEDFSLEDTTSQCRINLFLDNKKPIYQYYKANPQCGYYNCKVLRSTRLHDVDTTTALPRFAIDRDAIVERTI
jgi:hypothetical protein